MPKNVSASPHAISTLLFDVGGVLSTGTAALVRRRLADMLDCSTTALDALWNKHGRDLSTGRRTPESFAIEIAAMVHADPAVVLDAWHSAAKEAFLPNLDTLKLAAGLHSRICIGILSNTNPLHARACRDNGIYANFEPILLSCDWGCAKPAAEIFRRATATLDVRPKHCALIDDRFENVVAARRFGLAAIEFSKASQLKNDLVALGVSSDVGAR